MATKRGVDADVMKAKKRKKGDNTLIERAHLIVGAEEESFPRGGSSSFTPLEVRKIKQEAEKDVLFGSHSSDDNLPRKKKKSVKKTSTSEQNNDNIHAVENVLQQKAKSLDILSYKKLSVGMKFLGAIKEVNELDLSVCLTNGLSGFIHIMRINEKFTSLLKGQLQEADNDDDEQTELPSLGDLFEVGKLIPCVITELESTKHGHKRIQLSAEPELVNSGINPSAIKEGMVLPGYVSSVEDHGYLVSFGIKGASGFLPKKSVKTEVQVGRPLQLLVESVDGDGRVFTVTADEEAVHNAVMTEAMKLKFSTLLPGMVVKGSVIQVFPSGLSVSFLGGFEGTVDILHLPECGGDGQKLEKNYPPKKKVDCRIIYINSSSKKVGLSLQQQIVKGKAHEFGRYGVGDIIDKATVTRVDQGLGILLTLSHGVMGYVHISRVSDERVEKLGKKFKCDSKHRCRILGFNSLDGVATMTMERSVIEQPFIRYDDIKPGSVVEGTIITVEKFGMLVSVSEHMRGLCPSLHLADISLKHPELKLKEGKTVKCRVLSVEPDRRKLLLTHKKTLVKSSLSIITSYDDCRKPGTSAHGFIIVIKDYGCIVSFYNNVRGLVPRVELGIPPQESPHAVFYVGQVVECHVLSCQPQESRLKLSFKSNAKRILPSGDVGIKAGTIVDVDVVSKSPEGLDVLVQPSGFPAFVPLVQLSDHPSHWEQLLSVYGPTIEGGSSCPRRVPNVLFYGATQKEGSKVSFKKSLIKFAHQGTFLSSFDDIEVNMHLPGFVKKIMDYGVFIEFTNEIFGLAPNMFLADHFVSDASAHFQVGQSMVAKVKEIDQSKKRFLVSLKLSECKDEENVGTGFTGLELLQDLLDERKFIMESLASKSGETKNLASFAFDSIVEAKVTGTNQHGVLLQLESGVRGIAPHQLAHDVECFAGAIVYGCVLDRDLDQQLVYLTLSPSITDSRRKQVKIGRRLQAVVQLVTEEYLVVVLPQHGNHLAYAPAKTHLNDIRNASRKFAIGQKCTAIVKRSGAALQLSNFANSKPMVVTVQPGDCMNKEHVTTGMVTTATVKSVKEFQVNVSLCSGRLPGRVHISQAKDDIVEGESPLKAFKNGDHVQVKVLGFRDVQTHKFLPVTHKGTKVTAELSSKPSNLISDSCSNASETPDKALEDYKVGEEIVCFVKSISNSCMWAVVSSSVIGRVPILHLSTDVETLRNATSHFTTGSAYKCVVLGIDKSYGVLDLSLTVKPDCRLEKDRLVVGRIRKILPESGLLVDLPFRKSGKASLVDLHDKYENDPLSKFQLQQFVKCCILSSDGKDKFDLSLRPSRTEAETTAVKDKVKDDSDVGDREIKSLSELKEGQIVRGYIKSISDVGVFVILAHDLTALVKIRNLSNHFVKDWKLLFPRGKLVTGKVLSIDPTKGLIELSLKRNTPDIKGRNKRKQNTEKETAAVKKPRKDSVSNEEESSEEGELSDGSSEGSKDDEEDISSSKKPRLQISAGFNWNVDGMEDEAKPKEEEESSESENEISEQTVRKKSKRQKRAAKKAEEEFLFKTEQALLDQDRAPETADEFDRLLLSSPGSSVVWLQYMAFHLQTTEIDKARAVAERALKTIPFREEQEKLNIWVALMNLENMYGTQESLVKVFERALQYNEPKMVFLQLINIYVRSNKMELAEQLCQTMVKRFNQSKKVWINFGLFYMKSGRLEAARKLLQRSLKSLPKRKHVETIEKFAIMEFRYGEPQRGQTLFESVLSNYPKRTDLWSVYIDMMQKQGDPEPVRQIFERLIHMNLSSKKMKFFFKRYLDFERKFGDDLSEERVKTKAMQYVESKVAVA